MTSFWYALGDDAADRLHAYAHRYLAIFGDEMATLMADLCTASSAAGCREAIDRLEDAGCDELLLVPTTADPDEVDRIADIVF